MRTLAVICARAGSKALPGKNSMLFCGEPLILRSVRVAQQCHLITDLVVSTDCPTIKSLCKDRVRVVDRPAEFAKENSPIHEAVNHALEVMETESEAYDIVVCLQNSSPFRTSEDIDNAIRTISVLRKAFTPPGIYQTVMTVTKAGHHNPDMAYEDTGDGIFVSTYEKHGSIYHHPHRRQDCKPAYYMAGVVFAMDRDTFVKGKDDLIPKQWIPSGRIYCLEIPAWRAVDIHDFDDFRKAKAFAERAGL